MPYLKIGGIVLLGICLWHAWLLWGLLAIAGIAMIVFP